MDNLKKNSAFYSINMDGIDLDLYQEAVIEVLSSEFEFTKNRVLYLMYRNQDVTLIRNLIDQMGKKSIILYLYEEESDLVRLFSAFDVTTLKHAVQIHKIDKDDSKAQKEIALLLNQLFYQYTQVFPLISVSEDLDYLVRIKEILMHIRKLKENYAFLLGNDLNDTLYGLENRLKNLPSYANSPGMNDFISQSMGCYEGKPAIIVASGPSLDKNIHFLKAYQDKILILCCDGSYTTLLKNGIKAHFIGSVERVWRTYEAFYEGKTFDEDLLLIAPAVVRPEIPAAFPNRFLSMFKDKDSYGVFMHETLNEEKGKLWCGSSVAHLMFSFAEALKCNPIILAGQDLSYRRDGITHADDSEVKELKPLDDKTIWLKGNYEELVPSTPVWEKFLITYNELVHLAKANVINATEGGAFIEGTTLSTLEEALKTYCIETLRTPIDIYKSIETYHKLEDYLPTIVEKIDTLYQKFEGLYKVLTKAVEKNLKAIERFNKGLKTQKQLDNVYDAIDYVEKKVVKLIAHDKDMMMLFQYPIQMAIHKVNQIDAQHYTLETIAQNLTIHYEMLLEINHNCKRFMIIFPKNCSDFMTFKALEWQDDPAYDIDRI